MKPQKRVISKQLGGLLIERGLINEKQLKQALEIREKTGKLIGEVLVELGFVDEEAIAQALTAQYGFPYLPLSNYDISDDIVKLVPLNVANQYLAIPIDKIGTTLTVAMSNPLNLQAIDDIELISGCNVQTFISTATDIKNAIERYYRDKK